METLSQLWRKRQAVVRRIDRATQRVSPALAADAYALTVAIANHPTRSEAGIDLKLALARELAEHAPDAALLLKLIETIQDGLHAARHPSLPVVRVDELISTENTNKAIFPL